MKASIVKKNCRQNTWKKLKRYIETVMTYHI